jgi:hypothetical protein
MGKTHQLAAKETDAVLDSLDPDKDWPWEGGLGLGYSQNSRGYERKTPTL